MPRGFMLYTLPVFAILTLVSGAVHAHQRHGSFYDAELVQAAYRFERASRAMHRSFHHAIGRSHLTRKAHELKHAARHYRKALEQEQTRSHVRSEFRGLADLFRDLRHEYRHAHFAETPGTRRAFRRLVHAFYHLREESRFGRHYAAGEFYPPTYTSRWRHKDPIGWEAAGQ